MEGPDRLELPGKVRAGGCLRRGDNSDLSSLTSFGFRLTKQAVSVTVTHGTLVSLECK